MAVAGVAIGGTIGLALNRRAEMAGKTGTLEQRQEMFQLLQPVALRNCQLQRFGEKYDGGYLLCGNLLNDVRAGYSYGIGGYDQWGCDLSTARQVPVHQYDCFNTTQPVCSTGQTIFHRECVGESPHADGERRFDSMQNQIASNGDGTNHIVLKIDVEGAEWGTFLTASDELLQRIDQIAVEFHGVDAEKSIAAVQRLKQFFEVAYIHFNNATCTRDMNPFPAWAYEVLFVNKRLAVLDPTVETVGVHPLATRNIPFLPDCQLGSE